MLVINARKVATVWPSKQSLTSILIIFLVSTQVSTSVLKLGNKSLDGGVPLK